MKFSTPAILRWRSLLASMSFAVSLLIILSAASVIGTVLLQDQPETSYIRQFGVFWFPFFKYLGLYSVYNSIWYVSILAVLITSISLCLHRQIPAAIKGWKNFRFPHHLISTAESKGFYKTSSSLLTSSVVNYLIRNGHLVVSTPKKKQNLTHIVGKKKSWRFIGYFLAHSAIITICLGALTDGHLPLILKMHVENKKPLDAADTEYTPQNTIYDNSVSYRAQVILGPNAVTDGGVININGGTLIQKLPFFIGIKSFDIDWYPNGTPKKFSSAIWIKDKVSHKIFERNISVNNPLRYKDFSIYQSSFSNGNTNLTISLLPLTKVQTGTKNRIQIKVGQKIALQHGKTLEITNFREKNIENKLFMDGNTNKSTKPSPLGRFFSSAGTLSSQKFIDLGPSFTYTIMNSRGKITEYHNFSRPIKIQDRYWTFLGIRQNLADNFRYWKIPTDAGGNLKTFFNFRNHLIEQNYHPKIISSFLDQSLGSVENKLQVSALLSKMLFSFSEHGFRGIFDILNIKSTQKILSLDQEHLIRIFEKLCLFVWQHYLGQTDNSRFWDYLLSISDGFEYSSTFIALLYDYKPETISVLEITKSPGLFFVYLGSIFLIVGVIIMLYIREQKIFVLVYHRDDNLHEVLVDTKSNQHNNLKQLIDGILKEIEVWSK
ncbi:cytochrome c biogenesis protein ResB [Candidatus Ichthyocystis hellenicum]|uniref:cytochrome c biogenesis protein ResB n=1 Tax=Candidatus Ichthyocystis hellenicum TaxID=1561003 RepID=UPI0015859744|nr:cytochrome c biogenesis protein ResB [Candidatus Ichthyocystis hellenicum]